MNNYNYDIYKKIISINPIIDKEYLSLILRLSEIEKIKSVDVSEVKESNTAQVIKAKVVIADLHREYRRNLFIKTSKPDQTDNPYREKILKECSFYELLLNRSDAHIPVPTCYDVFTSEQTGEFVVVLEDLSEYYTAPDNASFTDKNTWFSCAGCLADFHAAFWNGRIGESKFSAKSNQKVEAECHKNQEYLKTFLSEYGSKFDQKTIRIFENALTVNNQLIRENNQAVSMKNNVTICNGDSHIHNFMLPKDRFNKPILVDFQFWGTGLGTGDLAHLTRVRFPDEFKKNLQVPLVKHYYETLLANRVTNYSWETCLRNYRMEIADMVLIPMWQACCFGLKYEDWGKDINGLIANYEYMNCEELSAVQ